MPEITDDQLTIIENAFVKIREALDPESTPEDVMKMLLDAEQICSGILDKNKDAASFNSADKGGPL